MHSQDSERQSDPAGLAALQNERGVVLSALAREWEGQDEVLTFLYPIDPDVADRFPYSDVVLAAGLPRRDQPAIMRARCQLAAALASLMRALNIHGSMAEAVDGTDQDRAGTAVLMGDYHFARAAQLVTQLGSPVLLEAFARVLKGSGVIELQRQLRATPRNVPDPMVTAALGIRCCGFLPGACAEEAARSAEAWLLLARQADCDLEERALAAFLDATPPHQRLRWRETAAACLRAADRAQISGAAPPPASPVASPGLTSI